MRYLQKLKWQLERHHIRQLMMYLCLGMAGVFVLDILFRNGASALLGFDRGKIFRGQIWRLVTFLAVPPGGGLIATLLYLYFYYSIGTMLENQWGGASFNMYYLLGWACCVVSGLIGGVAVNDILNLSLILAFAMTYPEQQFMLFFIVPVKARWFGVLTGVILVLRFIFSSLGMKLCIIMSLLPFILFFGQTALKQVKTDIRRIRNRIGGRRY